MNRIVGLVVLMLFSVACSPAPTTPPPSQPVALTSTPATSLEAAPTDQASPSAVPAMSTVAAEPIVVCETPDKAGVTLTCESGVAAARAVVGHDEAVATVEFYIGWGPLCGPGKFCALLLSNTGHVFFDRTGGLPDLVVRVTADDAGRVTASAPAPWSAAGP